MTPTCEICGESLAPRGSLPPRFCPRCGRRLADFPAVSRAFPRDSRDTSAAAVAALVLGILGFLVPFGCLPFGMPAILIGVIASHRIDRSTGRLSGQGMATAGIVLGIISVILWLVIAAAR